MDPGVLTTNRLYAFLAGLLQAADVRDFIVKACVALIAVYVLKDIYLLFMYNLQFSFTYKNKARIANGLMGVYMKQSYLELINHNVADLQRSLSTDVDLCFALILALLNILCESFTALTLVVYLMIQSPPDHAVPDGHHGGVCAAVHPLLPPPSGRLRPPLP